MRARRLLGEVPKAEGVPCSAQGKNGNKKKRPRDISVTQTLYLQTSTSPEPKGVALVSGVLNLHNYFNRNQKFNKSQNGDSNLN